MFIFGLLSVLENGLRVPHGRSHAKNPNLVRQLAMYVDPVLRL